MKRKGIVVFLLLAVCFVLCAFVCSCNNQSNDNVVIDILKIGKADCIVINTGTHIVMIDTGEKENLPKIHYYMNEKQYTKIDMLILTHYDKDHIGGASEIIDTYGVKTVIESQISSVNEHYIDYHNTLSQLSISPIKLTKNYQFSFDNCNFEINIPKKTEYEVKQDNNSSLVVSMINGNNRFLFCADAMELRLSELIEDNIGHYDFVKLPYHGNYLENYSEFLNMITPEYGAITCSNKNPPSNDTLALLEEYGIKAYQTRNGTISVFSDGKQIIINQK